MTGVPRRRGLVLGAALLAACTAVPAERGGRPRVDAMPGSSWASTSALDSHPAITQARVVPVTRELVLAGERKPVDLFLPRETGPAPVVVIAHGFSRNRTTMRGWGDRFAAAGYLVAIPDLPTRSDHARNGAGINDVLQQLESGAAAWPVDTTREAVMGFSAGGLSTALAAAANRRVALWIGLDPVDRGGAGAAAVTARAFPAVLITAVPSACNANGNGAALAAALPGPWLSLAVAGASHCDPESPGSRLCGMFCAGGWNAGRHAAFADYATAALDAVLRCRPAAWARLDAARADVRLTRVTGPGLETVRERCTSLEATPAR